MPVSSVYRSARWIGVLLLVGLAACARPVGDFGRARPSAFHDQTLSRVGADWAARRGEPVSAFNMTDDEAELRNRAWNFVRAPHAGDWWLNTLSELERTRLLPPLGEGGPSLSVQAMVPKFALPALAPAYDLSRYYRKLQEAEYASSDTRFSKTIADMMADASLVPSYCATAARVRQIDVERVRALNGSTVKDPVFIQNAYDRVAENEAVNAWFWRALRYRLGSYRFAIDHLAVETPSTQLWSANRAYDHLAGMRCNGAPPLSVMARAGGSPLPSRLLAGPDPFDEPVLQK